MARLSNHDENVAPSAFTVSDDDNEFSASIAVDDDDDDDFEVETKKPIAGSKRKPTTGAKKPAAKRAKKEPAKPLQTLDNHLVFMDKKSSSTSSTSSPSPDSKPMPVETKATSTKSASSQYQRLSQLEHVLKRPDTYIGSVELTESNMWICDDSGQMKYKTVSIVPGLYKIFDEILVNAADNKIRDPSMDTLNVTIDSDSNTISIYNNGKGIPIEIHEKEKIYIPELIFGNLLTSSNYDDDEKKVTGGRNGYGAKVSLSMLKRSESEGLRCRLFRVHFARNLLRVRFDRFYFFF
jgi:DNA topoisomerase-2